MEKLTENSVVKHFLYGAIIIMIVLAKLFLMGCDGGSSNDDENNDTGGEETYTYTLSGMVSGSVTAGVKITLSGSASETATTDADGCFEFSVENGTYTLMPSLSGYDFSPESLSVTIFDEKFSNADFISTVSSGSEADDSDIGDQTDYDSATLLSGGTYSSDASGAEKTYYSYTATAANTPALKVEPGGSLILTHTKITKTGNTSNLENSGFYGFNSGVLVSSSGSSSGYSGTSDTTSLSMTNCTVTTDASGANGVFAFGEDASAILDHVTIITTGDSNSRGVDATYGGSITITNSTISTQGGSCAALATDRYENYNAPSVTANNVYATTTGTGSPGIYCTGTFEVKNSTLIATGSEAAAIEGLNSITLENTAITGYDKWGVIIYQSMSGDSSIGTGSFMMTGGTLTNNDANGPLFFICNTDAVIDLDSATLENASGLLLVAGKASTAGSYIDNVNSDWGTSGGDVSFTATDESLEGEIIICDSSSAIDLTLLNSNFKGAINSDNNGGTVDVTLDADSTWEVTGTSYIGSLINYGTITGSGTLYVGGTQYDY